MSALLQTEIHSQRFTGYFIPVELDYMDLNACEQKLLSMIDSLERDAPDYCYASNEYLAARLRISESRISFYLTKFKRMGLIEIMGYDGRRRKMRVLKENWYKKPVSKKFNSKKELCVKTSSQTDFQKKNIACFHEVRLRENTIENTKNIPYIDNKEDIKDNQPTKPSFQRESGSVVGSSSDQNLTTQPTAIPIVSNGSRGSSSVVGFYESKTEGKPKNLSSIVGSIAPAAPVAKATPIVRGNQNTTSDNCYNLTSKETKSNNNPLQPYKCLLNLGITFEDAMRITMKYPEELVIRVVAYCTRPEFKSTSLTLDRPIFHYCKHPEQMTPTKAEIQEKKKLTADQTTDLADLRREKTRRLAWELATMIPDDPYAKSRCRMLGSNDGIEISNDRISSKVYYRDPNFRAVLEHQLQKCGFPVPESVGRLP